MEYVQHWGIKIDFHLHTSTGINFYKYIVFTDLLQSASTAKLKKDEHKSNKIVTCHQGRMRMVTE